LSKDDSQREGLYIVIYFTLKKRFEIFPSLTNLSLGGNNLGGGKIDNLFYSVRAGTNLLRMTRVEQLTDDPPEAPLQKRFFSFKIIPITSLMTSGIFLKAHL
jgi:hypothetical protein